MNVHINSNSKYSKEVRHWIKIPGLSHAADNLSIERALMKLKGIKGVECYLERKKIRVIYTPAMRDFNSIIERLEATGFPVSDDWWSRQTRHLFQYLDHNRGLKSKVNAEGNKRKS